MVSGARGVLLLDSVGRSVTFALYCARCIAFADGVVAVVVAWCFAERVDELHSRIFVDYFGRLFIRAAGWLGALCGGWGGGEWVVVRGE